MRSRILLRSCCLLLGWATTAGAETFSGVVEDGFGRPVRGAQVSVRLLEPAAPVTATSGAGGVYTVTLPDRALPESVVAQHPSAGLGFAPLWWRGGRSRVTLLPTATARGSVTGPDGRGVAGANVRVVGAWTDWYGGPYPLPEVQAVTRTGADGRYVLTGVPAQGALLEISQPGLATVQVTQRLPDQPELAVALQTAAVVQGLVSLEGMPLPGAKVRLLARSQERQTAVADAVGRYRFEHLATGKWRVEAPSTPAYRCNHQDLEVTQPGEVVEAPELVLGKPAVAIAGRVIDGGTGRGVAGVTVFSMGGGCCSGSGGPAARSDSAGRFTLYAMAGPATVYAETPAGYWHNPKQSVQVMVAPGMDPLELRLLPAKETVVKGVVVDPQGRPVYRPVLYVQHFRPNRRSGRVAGQGPQMGGADGSFTLRLRRDSDVQVDVHAGDLTLAQPLKWSVGKLPSSPLRVKLQAGRTQTITGQVVDVAGAPVPGLVARLAGSALLSDSNSVPFSLVALTDARGVYRLREVPRRWADLTFSIDLPADLERVSGGRMPGLGSNSTRIPTLVVRRLDGAISGTVMAPGGAPAVGALVFAADYADRD